MARFDLSGLRISRRAFVIGTAASAVGVAFGIHALQQRGHARSEATAARHAAGATDVEVSAWVVIRPDNTVLLKIPQAEFGQGGLTTVAQMLAEELEVDWQSIVTEFYEPSVNLARNNVYVWTATLSSNGVSLLFDPARIAGAQIRTMMIQAAASVLKLSPGELSAQRGSIVHLPSGRSMSYAELAPHAARLPIPDPAKVELKRPADWSLVGRSVERLDIPSKVDGSTRYGIDVQLPGMKYAAIRQSPVFGGRLKSFDASAVALRQGVYGIVKVSAGPSGLNEPTPGWGIDYGMDDAVAVVADDWWTAKQALQDVQIVWDNGKFASVSSESLMKDFLHALDHPDGSMKPARVDGDAPGAIKHAATVLEAEYRVPFSEHATMEPMNCTALVTSKTVDVWVGSQFPDEALRVACHYAGLPVEQGRVHLTMAGGGFGRRIVNDYVAQAVQIARTMPGIPVKLVWTREECIQRGYYPPMTVTRLKAGLDRDGNIVGWIARSVGGRAPDQTYGTARIPQTIPNVLVEYQAIETPPPFGWKRGVGFAQHTWMNQCFIDEIAHTVKRDPFAFQLSLLNAQALPAKMEKRELAVRRLEKQRAVLEAVAELANWQAGPPSPQIGRGIAVHDMSYWPEYDAAAAAAVAEVSIDGGKQLKVHRLYVAIECGRVVNPDNARAQIEGSVAFGLSDVLFSEITLAGGRVVQSNFHDYPLLRLAQMPEIIVRFLQSDSAPHGIGETAVPLTIAAVVNAVHAAGGPRVRRLPLLDRTLRLRS